MQKIKIVQVLDVPPATELESESSFDEEGRLCHKVGIKEILTTYDLMELDKYKDDPSFITYSWDEATDLWHRIHSEDL